MQPATPSTREPALDVIPPAARDSALPFASARGSLAVRVTFGTLRSRALFEDSAIKQNEPGRFTAKPTGTALVDCPDAALLDRAGEECADIGGIPIDACGCDAL